MSDKIPAMRRILAVLFFIALGCTELAAEPSVKTYKQVMLKTNSLEATAMKTYITGLGDGITWTEAQVEHNKGKPLFCIPVQLALTTDNFVDILNREIKEMSSLLTADQLETSPIGSFLVIGLVQTFPCTTSQTK
jgi:hypothetical protein